MQLWNGTAWVDATNDPCPAACDGTFPGMDLTAAEQESTTGGPADLRREPDPRRDRGRRPRRAAGRLRRRPLDRQRPAPDPGAGRSATPSAPTARPRSRSTTLQPARRRASCATPSTPPATPPDGTDPVSDDDSDDVVIIDVPITTTTDKDWRGGPLAIPVAGHARGPVPARAGSRVTTTNTTPPMVDQLQITDPAPGSTDTAGPVRLLRPRRASPAINVPAGATEHHGDLTCPDGEPTDAYTRDAGARADPGTMPCDVVPRSTRPGALRRPDRSATPSGVLALDVRLRATNRQHRTPPITADDAPDRQHRAGRRRRRRRRSGTARPPRTTATPATTGPRRSTSSRPTFGVTAGKSISPATQKEGDDSPVTVTISAAEQRHRPARTSTAHRRRPDVLERRRLRPDGPVVDAAAAGRVRAGLLPVRRHFTDATVADDDRRVGGTWTCQALPGGGPPFSRGEPDPRAGPGLHRRRPGRATSTACGSGSWPATRSAGRTPPTRSSRCRSRWSAATTCAPAGRCRPPARTRPPRPARTTPASSSTPSTSTASPCWSAPTATRLHADDTADAPYTYEHLTVGVEVDKTPTGEVQPGHGHPVQADLHQHRRGTADQPGLHRRAALRRRRQPADLRPGQRPGGQLAVQLRARRAPPRRRRTATRCRPTQDDITITEAGDTITFAMPDGTVLEPGQTYTITIELDAAPGSHPRRRGHQHRHDHRRRAVRPGACA